MHDQIFGCCEGIEDHHKNKKGRNTWDAWDQNAFIIQSTWCQSLIKPKKHYRKLFLTSKRPCCFKEVLENTSLSKNFVMKATNFFDQENKSKLKLKPTHFLKQWILRLNTLHKKSYKIKNASQIHFAHLCCQWSNNISQAWPGGSIHCSKHFK